MPLEGFIVGRRYASAIEAVRKSGRSRVEIEATIWALRGGFSFPSPICALFAVGFSSRLRLMQKCHSNNYTRRGCHYC
jgi:hypothetical protein